MSEYVVLVLIIRLEIESLQTQSHLHFLGEESEHEYSKQHRMEGQPEFVFLKYNNTILSTAYKRYDDFACALDLCRSRDIVVCTGTTPFE